MSQVQTTKVLSLNKPQTENPQADLLQPSQSQTPGKNGRIRENMTSRGHKQIHYFCPQEDFLNMSVKDISIILCCPHVDSHK